MRSLRWSNGNETIWQAGSSSREKLHFGYGEGKRGGQIGQPQRTLADLTTDLYRWSQETFPTATAVLTHLPFARVPFIFSVFLLVQALVTQDFESWYLLTDGIIG